MLCTSKCCFVCLYVREREWENECVCMCVSVFKRTREHSYRGPPMPHIERGFSESVMGIRKNIISYSSRMVNLLKPSWSLHAYSCYCPLIQPVKLKDKVWWRTTYVCGCTCVLLVELLRLVWGYAIMDISINYQYKLWHLSLFYNITVVIAQIKKCVWSVAVWPQWNVAAPAIVVGLIFFSLSCTEVCAGLQNNMGLDVI